MMYLVGDLTEVFFIVSKRNFIQNAASSSGLPSAASSSGPPSANSPALTLPAQVSPFFFLPSVGSFQFVVGCL